MASLTKRSFNAALLAALAPAPAALAQAPGGPVDEGLYVDVGGAQQWITLRGADRANPAMLILHGGPGLPLSPAAPVLFEWEKLFTLVQWDQPGAGGTAFKAGDAPGELSIARFRRDGIAVADYARGRLGAAKLVLFAIGWGSLLALELIKARPDLFSAYVGTGQVVGPKGERLSYDLAREAALSRGDTAAAETLRKLGPPPYRTVEDRLAKQALVGPPALPPGVIEAARSGIMNTKIYTPPPAGSRWAPAMPRTPLNQLLATQQAATAAAMRPMLQELSNWDARALGRDWPIPMFVFQGEADIETPTAEARAWMAEIGAPRKAFEVIPAAGHNTLAFADVLLRLMARHVRPAAAASAPPDPRPGGFTREGLAFITPLVGQMVNAGVSPGIVSLVWRKGQIAQLNAVGVRDLETKAPIEATSLIRIASMSKPITVACALTLVDEGRMKLSDPVTRWVPELADMRVLKAPDGPLDQTYPAPRAITIGDLMSHTSGLSYFFTAQGPLMQRLSEIEDPAVTTATPDAWLKRLGQTPLAYAPGERWNYGVSIDVLGLVVGRITGRGFRQALAERITGPLGMKDTDFWIAPEKRDRQVRLYASDSATRGFTPFSMPSFDGPAPPALCSGGAGLATTAEDYLTFTRMLLGAGQLNGVRVLRPATARMMGANRLTPAQRQPMAGASLMAAFAPNWKAQGFGLGMSVVTNEKAYAALGGGLGFAGAYGWAGLYGGWFQIDPAQEMILIWLPQSIPAVLAQGMAGGAAPPTSAFDPRQMGSMIANSAGIVGFQRRSYAALAL